MITNQFGEIVSFFITPGNVADNNLTLGIKLCKGLCGKLFGDKGYICEKLREALAKQELFLITKIKRNMKRAMINALSPTINVIFGELERSGNPRSEFHTAAKQFQGEDFDTKIASNLIEKITV